MITHLEQSIGHQAEVIYSDPLMVDMPDTAADIAKAKRLLQWSPRTNPSTGFQKTGDWHLANSSWLDEITL